MGCVSFLYNNYTDSDVVSNSYVSSEQSAFPASNLYNFERRSKVWRSNGYFVIDDTNKTLVFRETIATDLTATLTTGSYASSTALFTEIKTQLEAVGGSTYTITRDNNTNKIKFTSNGVGGGGIFELIWTSSTGLASLLGFLTTENDTGSLTYTADILKIHTYEFIKWDMGISTNPKAFCLIGSRNNPIKISPSAVLKLQGNETDNWGTPSYEVSLTYNDSIIALLSSTGIHTEELRYWRLYIEDPYNSQGYVEIGFIYLGDILNTTRGAAQFPLSIQQIDNSRTIFSEGGQSFSDIRELTERFKLEWLGLTKGEKEDFDTMFLTVGTYRPFFLSLDPNEAFSSDGSYYIRYAKFESPPSFELLSPNNFTCSMTLREEL